MPRQSVTLSEDLDAWVREEADRRDRSISQVIAQAVANERERVQRTDAEHTDVPHSDAEHSASPRAGVATTEDLAALEAEVDALRERVAALEPVGEAAIRQTVADLAWGLELADTDARRQALADVAVRVQSEGSLSRSAAREQVAGELDDLADRSIGKMLSLLGQLEWIDAGGQGSQQLEWIGD